MERIGRLDRASGLSTDDDFSAKLPPVPTGDFKRASATAKAPQDADDGVPTLTKAELAELVFQHVGLNKREAKDMVEAFFDEVSDALERGESVKLTGFGNFQLRDKVSRPGRNPKTGVQVNIPARRVVTFHASQKLKIVADDSAKSAPSKHVDANARE
jgi:integration host factor subunit alpha